MTYRQSGRRSSGWKQPGRNASLALTASLVLSLALLLAAPGGPAQAQEADSAEAPDTVHVAPPTGEKETDRARILAALDEVETGETVQFAAGTYVVGDFIEVPVPEIELVGHPDGTTLQGCEPGELVEPRVPCHGLQLTGDRQTVRDLTFQHTSSALWVGCCWNAAESGYGAEGPHVGGHLIEGNTFRSTWNGIRVIGNSPDPVVIRDNDFVDTWHAAVVNGRTAHILDNRVSVPEPERVPVNGHAGLAMSIIPFDTRFEHPFTCAGNVIAGNRIEGHPEGIAIQAFRSGAACRENVIRDNTIVVRRARFTPPSFGVIGIRNEADSTLAGVPLALVDLSAEMASQFPQLPDDTGEEELVHDNLIEGNHVVGAEGVAIELFRASRNRVVYNTISDVTARDPFPGNTMYFAPEWREANGSGIWISPESEENQIVANTFEDIAGAAVFLEGDSNRVERRSASDSVRDLGTDNEVRAADSPGGSGRSHRQLSASPITTGAGSTVLPDTSEVLAAAEAFLGAFNRLDWEPFRAAFSPDATVFQPFGELFRNDGREEIAAFFRSFFDQVRAARDGPPYLDIVPEDLRIDPLGEAAVVTFHLPGEEEVGRRTLVFGRDAPEAPWRIAHLHASTLERPGAGGEGAGAPSREIEAGQAQRYAGRYTLSHPDAGGMTLTFRVGDDGLEVEVGDQVRELSYLGGHVFRDADAGYLLVFNVERDGRAVGITGLPRGLDRVDVFARVDENR